MKPVKNKWNKVAVPSRLFIHFLQKQKVKCRSVDFLTISTHFWRVVQDSNPGHIVWLSHIGRRALTTAPSPLLLLAYPLTTFALQSDSRRLSPLNHNQGWFHKRPIPGMLKQGVQWTFEVQSTHISCLNPAHYPLEETIWDDSISFQYHWKSEIRTRQILSRFGWLNKVKSRL